jgi:osmotically-inducible protein OsmY
MQILPITKGASGDLSELAERKLRESPYFFLRTLRCQCEDGILTLRGRVPYRQLRQFAESIVSRVDGVREVINRIEIIDPGFEATGARAARTAG